MIPLALLTGCFILWELFVAAAHVPRTVLAPPSAVFARLLSQPQLFVDNALVTLLEIAVGFGIGFIVGIAIAIAIVELPIFERTAFPLIVTSQVIPTFALAPLLVLWLGFGMEPKIIIIVVGVFFPITINMVKGRRSADPGIVNLMLSYRASRAQILRIVSFPASLPYLFAAMQLAVTYSVLGAVFVEWFGALKGLGKLTLVGQTRRQTDLMLASVILITVIAIVLVVLVKIAARLAMPWERAGDEAKPTGGASKARTSRVGNEVSPASPTRGQAR